MKKRAEADSISLLLPSSRLPFPYSSSSSSFIAQCWQAKSSICDPFCHHLHHPFSSSSPRLAFLPLLLSFSLCFHVIRRFDLLARQTSIPYPPTGFHNDSCNSLLISPPAAASLPLLPRSPLRRPISTRLFVCSASCEVTRHLSGYTCSLHPQRQES